MKVIYFFGLLGFLLLSDSIFIRTANAEMKSITVSVDGLACPFCAYGIEKKMKRLKGVKEIKILLNAGTVTLKCTENESPAFADVRSAVEDAGFTPRVMKITAYGTIIVDETKSLLFKFNDSEPPISLIDLKGNLKEKALLFAGNNVRVELIAEVIRLDGDDWALSSERVEEVSQ
ncbi:MAG: heavy-metal-associated domain-containing protein [Nitrospinales bacterium]